MQEAVSHTITLGEKHEEAPLGIRFASRAIITREDEILVMHEVVGDQWMLPGGGREEGESPEECCVREVKEETGFVVRLVDHFFTLDERCQLPGIEIPGLWKESQHDLKIISAA